MHNEIKRLPKGSSPKGATNMVWRQWLEDCLDTLVDSSKNISIFSGKFKQMKVKNQKSSIGEEQQDEKVGAVDQIKKKYGFSSSGVSFHPIMQIL